MSSLCVLMGCSFALPILAGLIYILGSEFIAAWERVQIRRIDERRREPEKDEDG